MEYNDDAFCSCIALFTIMARFLSQNDFCFLLFYTDVDQATFLFLAVSSLTLTHFKTLAI